MFSVSLPEYLYMHTFHYVLFIRFGAYVHVPPFLYVRGCVLCLWSLASHGCS